MKVHFLFPVFFLFCLSGYASDLKFSTPLLYIEEGNLFASFNVSWDNSWNTDKNRDAVWLFFKSIPGSGQARHIKVLPNGHTKIADFSDQPVELGFEVSPDSTGIFIFPNETYRGNISLTLKVSLDRMSFRGVNTRRSLFRVFGTEMVYIPQGSFTLGDPTKEAQEYGSIYQPTNGNGEVQLAKINSETSELKVAQDGDIFYQKKEGYEGDQTGIIPGSFPKGVASFYIMKYEISEGQYATFLNTLHEEGQAQRNITTERNYLALGGSIASNEGRFSSPHKNKPCKFTSWEDAMAYADWAGLRPMTEFEFTKASRGPRNPVSAELPWGTNNKYQVQRMPNEEGILVMNNGWGEEELSEENLAYFAASYYWVMDLAGSMWERMVSIGHPVGRNFKGSHGDGTLSEEATATNSDWPSGEADAGGVGFRGGGFYGYTRSYHNYNPFSPIAYRPYGGWHGIDRSNAYGGRLVRTSSR